MRSQPSTNGALLLKRFRRGHPDRGRSFSS